MSDIIDYKIYGDDMQIVEIELDPYFIFSQKVFQGILISFVCWPSFVL